MGVCVCREWGGGREEGGYMIVFEGVRVESVSVYTNTW